MWLARVQNLQANMRVLYTVAWRQYSDAMHSKIMMISGYNDGKDKDSIPWLLNALRSVTYEYEDLVEHGLSWHFPY